MDMFDPCSTTRTFVILSPFCERFPLVFKVVLLIWAGGNNGDAAFDTVFGAGNENGEARSKAGVLLGLEEWADPLPTSMSSNCISELLPASMSISTRLFERMFRKKAMS
jgi:hypothetical protein